MKNMRSIGVNEYAVAILTIESIAANMAPLVDQQNTFSHGSKPLGTNTARKPGSDYDKIIRQLRTLLTRHAA